MSDEGAASSLRVCGPGCNSPAAEATKAKSPVPLSPRQMAPSGVSAGMPRGASKEVASAEDVSFPFVTAQESTAPGAELLPAAVPFLAEAKMAWALSWAGDRRYAVGCPSRGRGARGRPRRPRLPSPALDWDPLCGARATTVRFRRLL